MTHTGPIPDSEGTFSARVDTRTPCRKCKQASVTVQIWESNDGAYTDARYECKSCGHHWWIEGPDA